MVNFNGGSRDCLVWGKDNSKCYIVKSAYNVFLSDSIWEEEILWKKLWHKRIPSKDNLGRRGIISGSWIERFDEQESHESSFEMDEGETEASYCSNYSYNDNNGKHSSKEKASTILKILSSIAKTQDDGKNN
ncbi:hypothetical protein TSUD_254300 [Trifolium subterraneum]|uniref:Uncharacterized protein n=1 Tax=Trifolium subterraneum TaxID=3900 RepID=A0A2Z6NIH3_TRISU|nr:hypothetical protein TSUD_254300 [Trifolium subterraneum]